MANYEADPAILTPFLPPHLELDSYQGRYFMSLVAFSFLNTRIHGVAIPFHRNFEEINLRFYVRYRNEPEARRGVVFIKEIVSLPTLAWVARLCYNENYVSMKTDCDLQRIGDQTHIRYSWEHGGRVHSLSAAVSDRPDELQAGSFEEFIAEHYWGYVAQKNGTCLEYRVDHPRWQVWLPTRHEVSGEAGSLYGPAFAKILQWAPTSVFVANGSAVRVEKGINLCKSGCH